MTSTPENPLSVLGVPRWLVSDAVEAQKFDTVLQIAEGFYRSLVRVYSPDLATGDAERFDQLTKAIDELRDKDDLAVACEFYADPNAAKARSTRRTIAGLKDTQRASLLAAYDALGNTHQWSVFGRQTPIAALLRDTLSTASWTLRSTDPGQMRISLIEHDAGIPSKRNLLFLDGAWQELVIPLTDEEYHLDPEAFGELLRNRPTVTRSHTEKLMSEDWIVIGGVAQESMPELPSPHFGMPQASLNSPPLRESEVPWSDVATAWWLPFLRPHVRLGDHVAIRSQTSRLVSLLQPMIAIAPLS